MLKWPGLGDGLLVTIMGLVCRRDCMKAVSVGLVRLVVRLLAE